MFNHVLINRGPFPWLWKIKKLSTLSLSKLCNNSNILAVENKKCKENDHDDEKNKNNEKFENEEEIKDYSIDKENNELGNIWNVWYYHRHNRQEAVHWMANQKIIYKLITIKDVMNMVNGIVSLKNIDINQDIAVFRDNIEPWYEDPANENGGQWTVALKKDNDYGEKLERIWSAMLSFCLFPNSPYTNIITGFSFAIRGSVYTKCYVWLTNCSDVHLILDIGARISKLSQIDDPFMFINNQTKKVMFSL